MFSKYEEISKLVRFYIEESLSKPMVNPSVLNDKIMQTYGVSLSEADLANLENNITVAKKTRNDYENGVKNSFKYAETDWTNALAKAKELTISYEAEAREYGNHLTNKLCIMLYKGPLTLDTMRELKTHGYDGTYGSTTMMQFYSLYNENQKLEEQNNEQKATILQHETEKSAYRQQYLVQFHELERTKVENDNLRKENESLKSSQTVLIEKLNEQSNLIQTLAQKVEDLSKKLPVQILEGIKGFFKPERVNTQVKEEQVTDLKTMH